jgi:hypothetical protein
MARTRVPARTALVLGAVAVALLAAACGAGRSSAPGAASSEPPPHPGGVGAALAAPDGSRVSVRGALFRDPDGVRLCDAIAESYPPQCGGPRIDVIGLPAVVPAMQHSDDGAVSWVESIELEGVVRGGRLFLDVGGLGAG